MLIVFGNLQPQTASATSRCAPAASAQGEAIRELEALRSPEAKQFVQNTYHGAVLATF
jgi:hypothetical protein